MRNALVACLLVGAAVPPADKGWTRASTEHFVVSGDAPAGEISWVATRLEALRSVLRQTLQPVR